MPYIYYSIDHLSQIIELYFENIPSASTRQKLKHHFWRWNPDKSCWYSTLNKDTETFAKQLGATKANQQAHSFKNNTSQNLTITPETISILKSLGYEPMNNEQLKQLLPELKGPEPQPITISNDEIYQNNGIAVVIIGLSGKITTIGIVKDSAMQNSSKNIYWIERSISKNIIYGIINKKPWIIYNNELSLIKFYSDTSLLRDIIAHSAYLSQNQTPAEIWVYSMKMPCPKHPKSIESVTAYITGTNASHSCKININYCSICKKYYINSEQYYTFARKYGLPNIRLMCDKYNSSYTTDYSDFREESILHVMGYNVSNENNLSDNERHKILLHAIDTNTLTKSEIISFLEFLQHRNEGNPRFDNACSKWHKDAEFIRNYNLDTQRKVTGNFKFRNL